MLIPSAFYGLYPEVKKAVRPLVKEILKGAPIGSATGELMALEPDSSIGVYMDQPAPRYEEEPHVHLRALPYGLFLAMVEEKVSWDRLDGWLEELLALEWGVLALMSRANAQNLLRNPEQMERFCVRAEALMPKLLVLGNRFLRQGNNREALAEYGDGFLYASINAGRNLERARNILEGRMKPALVMG
jgi:hypothetical protein